MIDMLCTFGPPAERQRHWILKFEDAAVCDMHFDDEKEAFRAFRRFSDNFTCTLFVTAQLPDTHGQPMPDEIATNILFERWKWETY